MQVSAVIPLHHLKSDILVMWSKQKMPSMLPGAFGLRTNSSTCLVYAFRPEPPYPLGILVLVISSMSPIRTIIPAVIALPS